MTSATENQGKWRYERRPTGNECDGGTNACCADSDLGNPSMPKFGGQCHWVVLSFVLASCLSGAFYIRSLNLFVAFSFLLSLLVV